MPAREVIEEALKKAFRAYNPMSDIQGIDFEGNISTNLGIEENIKNFARIYPAYIWSKEKEENPVEERLREDIEALREAGVPDIQISNALRRVGLNLERPSSAGLSAARKELAEMKQEIERMKQKQETPSRTKKLQRFSEHDIDLFYNAFALPFSMAPLRREPNAREMQRFDELLDSVQSSSLPLNSEIAQFKDLGRSLSNLAKGLRQGSESMRVRFGQQRKQELLDRELSGEPLTPEEREELAESLPEEEIEYQKPDIRIVAQSGPMKVDYPYVLGSYWTRNVAELNADNFRKKGFTLKIEET